jgi:hypothetical protein
MARVTPVTAVTRLAGDIWGVSAGYLQEPAPANGPYLAPSRSLTAGDFLCRVPSFDVHGDGQYRAPP